MTPSSANLALPPELRLRPVVSEDMDLLERIYASTRAEELAQTGWDAAQVAVFLRFQFQAQHHHYRTHYANAEFLVVERSGEAAGRLYLHWRPQELRIVDIALLPAHRAAGAGGALIGALMDLARQRGIAVSIHVEKNNRAMGLYRRLGFCRIGEHGVYDLMEWRPGT